MSAVIPYHVPQTVTSDVPSTLTCYNNAILAATTYADLTSSNAISAAVLEAVTFR